MSSLLIPVLNLNKNSFGSYLAGLIEGDGSIKVPETERSQKAKKLYPQITIIFVEKDLPLAELISKKLDATLNKGPGKFYVLSVYKKASLYLVANYLNGKFRTPKIEALHRLIIWFNSLNEFPKLEVLPVDNSDIKKNFWFAGFSDSDANFLISFTIKDSLIKNINFTYRISQKQNYHRISETVKTDTSFLPVMSSIVLAFNSKVEII